MSSLQTLNKKHKELLYEQVRDFILKGYVKYLTDSKIVDGFLIFDIGNEQSIHINPNLNKIVLVDNLTWHNENYDTEDNVMVLVSFFTTILEKINDFNKSLGTGLTALVAKTLGMHKLDTATIYFETEVKYYKSLFSGHAGNYVGKPSGVYSFRLPDKKVLHFIATGKFLTDKGLYFIQDPSKKYNVNIYEPQCTNDLLRYLKELCKDPQNLKNLAKV